MSTNDPVTELGQPGREVDPMTAMLSGTAKPGTQDGWDGPTCDAFRPELDLSVRF
jgi:hypothetical protein